jgi:hypothetical protein
VAALAAAAGVRVVHAVGYFFLFDDFALNGQASGFPLRDLVATPLFGFYRPGYFLVTRAAHAVFGWHTPAGYAALVLALHAANTAMVAALARRLFDGNASSYAAAALFFLSPWSAEAVFWVSGGFDVLATFGVLVGAWASLAFAETGRRGLLVAVAAGTVIALLSKESAVVMAGVTALLLLENPASAAVRRAALALGVIVCLTAVYLVLRRLVLSSLGGVYGDWAALVAGANVSANLSAFVRAFLVWPAPHDVQMRAVGLMALTTVPASIGLVGLVLAGISRLRLWVVLHGCAVLAVLPVVWVGLSPGSSGGGRVLYLAGVFFALTCGLGVHRLSGHRRLEARWAAIAAVAVVLMTAAASLEAQRDVWGRATRLSRASIEAFRPYDVGGTEPLHIDNLPFWFEEGPYVIKSYAFGYYYAPAAVPPVTATALTLTAVDGRVSVTTRQPEPGAPPQPEASRRVALSVGLP